MVGADGAGDLAGEQAYLLDQWLEGGDEREHDGAAGFELGFAGAALRGAAEPDEQFGSAGRPQ